VASYFSSPPMTRRILLVLALLKAPQLSAQLVRSLPSGVSEFRIEGSFEGQAMEPWRGTIEVHDTVLDGRPAFAATHIVHHLDGVFHLTSAWTKSAGRTVIAYDNGGREPNRCRVSIDSGKATATIRTASDPELSAKPLDVRGDVIADFAAGEWMAAKTLAAG